MTGASVAGATAAFWLARAGYDVTVLERADELRTGGQNVDVRGTGREVLRRMGLEDVVRENGTGEVGTRFVDEHGATVAELGVDTSQDADGPTAELEVLRGTLAQLVVDVCDDSVQWRFGDHIVALDDDDGIDVSLANGSTERFDLLVVAEGVDSSTRRLLLGDVDVEHPLGMYIAFGTIERTASDDAWWRFAVVPGSRQVSLRPDQVGTTRAMLTFLSDEPVVDRHDRPAVLHELHRRFGDLGWEVPRILDGFARTDDLYVDYLRQVRSPTWHRGRVCLIGDAAWCVTPIGGGGSTLALTGATVLAAFLSQNEPGQHATAFKQLEDWMRPLVDDAQHLPPGTPRIAAPRSRAGVKAFQWGARVAALPAVRSVAQRLTSGPQAARELPTVQTTG